MRLVHSIARYRLTLPQTRKLASRLAGKIVIQNEMTIQILKDVFSDFHKQKTQPITHVVIIGAQKQLSLTDTGACFVVTLKFALLNVLQKSPKSVMGLRSI